jgi:hypothetical protein
MTDNERLRRPPSKGFHCGERPIDDENNHDEEVSNRVLFHCKASDSQELIFYCRDVSCGVLLDNETSLLGTEEEDDDAEPPPVDPNFFDSGYTLAGRTGFQVWAGTRLLLDSLLWPQPCDSDRLKYWQQQVPRINILELGAGIGVVGTLLAYAGASVLLTDLPTLVHNAIAPNLKRNSTRESITVRASASRFWSHNKPVRIGQGWAAATPLNWTKPLSEQIPEETVQELDLIVASDCVFLKDMLDNLLNTVEAVFEVHNRAHTNRSPVLLLSFQRRDSEKDEKFTTVTGILEELQRRRWSITCLCWAPNVIAKEQESQVFVFELLYNGY